MASRRRAIIGSLLLLALSPVGGLAASSEGAEPQVAAPGIYPLATIETIDSKKGAGFVQTFQRSAGSNFKPRSSTTTYSYFGGGCLQRNSVDGDSWFTLDLQIPDGSVIDFLRVYYYDNDATHDIDSELWAFDGAGGTTLIAEADSSGSPGYGSAGSSFFSHTVDNINESLVVIASVQGGVGSDLALCGVRLRFQAPLPPLVFRDGFES